jgi:hypothetical protein
MQDKLKVVLIYDHAGRVAKARLGDEEFKVQSAQPCMVMGTTGLMLHIPNVQVDYESPPDPTTPAAVQAAA